MTALTTMVQHGRIGQTAQNTGSDRPGCDHGYQNYGSGYQGMSGL